jgi:hypothetical protein
MAYNSGFAYLLINTRWYIQKLYGNANENM